jgi:ribosomal protein L24
MHYKKLDAVNVVGEKYKGMHGTVIKETKLMVYVKLDGFDCARCVMKDNVRPSMPLSSLHQENAVSYASDVAELAFLKVTVGKINSFRDDGVPAEISDALDQRMKALPVFHARKEKYNGLENRLSRLLDVNIIGGKYKGMQGSLTGVMKDMYYVKLDGLTEEKRVRKTSMERISKVGLDGIASLRAELELLEVQKAKVMKILDLLLSS